MPDPTDEVFLLDGESVHSLPVRPMRVGLFGKPRPLMQGLVTCLCAFSGFCSMICDGGDTE